MREPYLDHRTTEVFRFYENLGLPSTRFSLCMRRIGQNLIQIRTLKMIDARIPHFYIGWFTPLAVVLTRYFWRAMCNWRRGRASRDHQHVTLDWTAIGDTNTRAT